MSKKKTTPPNEKVDATRICRKCGWFVRESDCPGGAEAGWVCAQCVDEPSPMPLIVHLGRDQFDTRQVFAGLKTVWVQEGDERFQREQEVRARLGYFYAAGENCIAFRGRAKATGTRLQKMFPTARFSNWSDDGEFIARFPVSLFDEFAAAVGVRRKRILSPNQRAAASVNLKKARDTQKALRQSDAKKQ